MRRSGEAPPLKREGGSRLDLCRRLLRRAAGRRDVTVCSVVPGFERRFDEWRGGYSPLPPPAAPTPLSPRATPGPPPPTTPPPPGPRRTPPAARSAPARQPQAPAA